MTTNTPAAWTITGTVNGESIALEAHANRYVGNGRHAVQLYTKGEAPELFADLSINAPQILLMDEERQIVIDHNVSDEVLDMVIDAGLIEEDPDMVVKIGMAITQVYSLTDKAAEWANTHAPAA